MSRPEYASIRCYSDVKEKLDTLSKKYKIGRTAIISSLIDLAFEFNFLEPDFKEKLDAAAKVGEREIQKERYETLEKKCIALRFSENKYRCIWGRKDRPPEIKSLSLDYDESLDLCEGCTKTLDIKNELKEKDLRINKLESKLNERPDFKMKIPICHKGAALTEDVKHFYGCPLKKGYEVSINNFCKIRMNGLPCALYAERIIGVAEELR